MGQASFNDIISLAGTQFTVPIWQRLYSWDKKEWNDLWEDIMHLNDNLKKGEPAEHFLGSIVVKTAEDIVGQVTKRMIIDGQQRLTTLLLICALLRDKAKSQKNNNLAEQIEDQILFNKYAKKPENRSKLLPTEADRMLFSKIINAETIEAADYGSQLYFAYRFFRNKLESKQKNYDIEEVMSTIRKLKIVTIRLDEKDNPNQIFETLNFRGRGLTQSDLVRNFFMMSIKNETKAIQVYKNMWFPMQQSLGATTHERIDNLERFLRHYVIMNKHGFVKENDVYVQMRERIKYSNQNQVIDELRMIVTYAKYYERLLYPDREINPNIRKGIRRLNRLKIGVHYPLLLKIYHLQLETSEVNEEEFVRILRTIESYYVRRLFHKMPTHSLNRLFASLCDLPNYGIADSIEKKLANKETWKAQYWPNDAEFEEDFRTLPIYRTSSERCRLILETLEESFGHPEKLRMDELTIEHIMPETLDTDWQQYLGDDWKTIHETYLHTIGNLTLIAGPKNSAIKNKLFHIKKRDWYYLSNVELTKELVKFNQWIETEIQVRAQDLSKIALRIWPKTG